MYRNHLSPGIVPLVELAAMNGWRGTWRSFDDIFDSTTTATSNAFSLRSILVHVVSCALGRLPMPLRQPRQPPLRQPPASPFDGHPRKAAAVMRSWTPHEDTLLRGLVGQVQSVLGNHEKLKWSENIASKIPGRSGKQCRERWVNHVNPTVTKKAWSRNEDEILIRQHQLLGKVLIFWNFFGRSHSLKASKPDTEMKLVFFSPFSSVESVVLLVVWVLVSLFRQQVVCD